MIYKSRIGVATPETVTVSLYTGISGARVVVYDNDGVCPVRIELTSFIIYGSPRGVPHYLALFSVDNPSYTQLFDAANIPSP